MRHTPRFATRIAAVAAALFVSLSLTALAQEVTTEPDPDEFIEVDQEPKLDYDKLIERVRYPEDARKAGIEGTVVVRVLIDREGTPLKYRIDHSDQSVLDEPAANAIMSLKFEPARQAGVPVMYWVSIPIKFQLD